MKFKFYKGTREVKGNYALSTDGRIINLDTMKEEEHNWKVSEIKYDYYLLKKWKFDNKQYIKVEMFGEVRYFRREYDKYPIEMLFDGSFKDIGQVKDLVIMYWLLGGKGCKRDKVSNKQQIIGEWWNVQTKRINNERVVVERETVYKIQ